MPESPAYLARDRAAYVGGHSFVLLIGVLALTAALAFFHDPNAAVYVVMRHAGVAFQWLMFIALGAGGVAVIAGLWMLHLQVEAAGHMLIFFGLVSSGLMTALSTPVNFSWWLSAFTVAFTAVCIVFRLWALVQATRLAAEIHAELEAAEKTIRRPDDEV